MSEISGSHVEGREELGPSPYKITALHMTQEEVWWGVCPFFLLVAIIGYESKLKLVVNIYLKP
jgi:hypothetical protein